MQTFPAIKRGDSFAFIAVMLDVNDQPLIEIESFLKAEVRDKNETLIAELTVSATEVPGEYKFSIKDTTSWPVGQYVYTDIQYTDDDVISSSDTMKILVERDVTR